MRQNEDSEYAVLHGVIPREYSAVQQFLLAHRGETGSRACETCWRRSKRCLHIQYCTIHPSSSILCTSAVFVEQYFVHTVLCFACLTNPIALRSPGQDEIHTHIRRRKGATVSDRGKRSRSKSGSRDSHSPTTTTTTTTQIASPSQLRPSRPPPPQAQRNASASYYVSPRDCVAIVPGLPLLRTSRNPTRSSTRKPPKAWRPPICSACPGS